MIRKIRAAAHNTVRKGRELAQTARLSCHLPPTQTPLPSESGTVVAMTSYPARIRHAWRSIETIMRQEEHFGSVVLVLAEADFPRRELPRRIRQQEKRGLEILWTKRNGYSYDKLLPVRRAFEEQSIITVDDDLYFPPSLVKDLVLAADKYPGAIVGSRGWRVRPSPGDGQVHFGIGWERAVQGDHGSGLHLPGGNGCLYPPHSLDPMVDRLDLALELAPSNDDIWFWIQAVRAGTEFVCLGMSPHQAVSPQRRTPALSHVNRTGQDAQFQRVLRYFALDPESLLWSKPES